MNQQSSNHLRTRREVSKAALLSAFWLLGCAPSTPCEIDSLSPIAGSPAFAVAGSDYASSAVGLIDDRGELLHEAWLESGSIEPGLTTALSGDIALPTAVPAIYQEEETGRLVVLDRFGVDVITAISLPNAESIRQFPTTLPAEANAIAYRSNPQDLVSVMDNLWIGRSEPNLDPNAPDLDRGNDLLVVRERDGEMLGRIDLAELDIRTNDGNVIYARPTRMLRTGSGRVVVGLTRLSADYREHGPGAIAVITPTSDGNAADTIANVDLSPLINCGELSPIPSDASRFFVTCAGTTFGDIQQRRGSSGMARVHVPNIGDPVVEDVWTPSSSEAVVSHGAIPLDADHVLVAAMGDINGRAETDTTDRIVLLHLESGTSESGTSESGTSEVVLISEESFVLGPGALSPDGSFALIPDAQAGIVRLDTRDPHAVAVERTYASSPCRAYPAREIRRLAPLD